MKVHGRLCTLLALVLVALLPARVAAKSPPDRLTVEGPGLVAPVGIGDAADLAGFSPWGRGFVAWERGLVAATLPLERTYTVSFELEGRTIYVVHYAPDAAGGRGYLYFPGPEHPAYRLNIGTIIGASSSDPWAPEGKWHYATPEWDAVLTSALSAQNAIAPASAPTALPASGEPASPAAGPILLTLGAGLVLAGTSLRPRRWEVGVAPMVGPTSRHSRRRTTSSGSRPA